MTKGWDGIDRDPHTGQILNGCENPACLRKTIALYCCSYCVEAHKGNYDPDRYHSPWCDERARTRKGTAQ